MSEATASANVETGSAYSESGTGSSGEAGEGEPSGAANDNTPLAANDNKAVNSLSGGDEAQKGQSEAGMSGPAKATDWAGARPAANDDTPQAANNNAAHDSSDLAGQGKSASDARTEATGDLGASSTLEAGEGVPAEGALDFSKPLVRDFNSKTAVKKEGEDGAKRTGSGDGGGDQQRLKDTFNAAARDKRAAENKGKLETPDAARTHQSRRQKEPGRRLMARMTDHIYSGN
jgi:hypothetical protein